MPNSAHTDAYKESGVDTQEADRGLQRLKEHIVRNWPRPGTGRGAVELDIGYFANVVDIGASDENGPIGLALCTDGVGSKAIVAKLMDRYDTIGIDCVAMNVNDLICVGARPISFVDYIAIEQADEDVLAAIGAGLAKGAEIANVTISGGEISQLKEIVNGFDIVGTAVGTVGLDKINHGQNVRHGDVVVGVESSGIHSNGLTLARRAFFELNRYDLSHRFDDLDDDLGSELLRPTEIYVREVLEVLERVGEVKALINITSDGLLNLARVAADVGFVIDRLPPTPPIFEIIRRLGNVDLPEMYEVYNMGIGFCIVVAEGDADTVQSILKSHGKKSHVIGRAVDDPEKRVSLERQALVGEGKRFARA